MGVSEREELRDRVEAKRKRLEARLAEARAEGRKHGREAVEKIQQSLSDLKEMMAGGWDEVSEAVSAKLNAWLSSQDDDGEPERSP